MKYDIRCGECGRFCTPHTSGIPFGRCQDTEPPDEIFFCKECSDKNYKRCLRSGKVPEWWVHPEFTKRAAIKLNLVFAGPESASWGHWFRPYDVPEGFVLWKAYH